MYPEVDKKNIGKAYKDDLIKVIEKDIIKMQKGQEDHDGREEAQPLDQDDQSDKGNDVVRTSSGSFARVRTMS